MLHGRVRTHLKVGILDLVAFSRRLLELLYPVINHLDELFKDQGKPRGWMLPVFLDFCQRFFDRDRSQLGEQVDKWDVTEGIWVDVQILRQSLSQSVQGLENVIAQQEGIGVRVETFQNLPEDQAIASWVKKVLSRRVLNI